ncbi:DUF222 domain-containing protein, partial [Mycolicibacterium neworleansense]
AGQKHAAADAAVVHVLAEQATLEGTSDDPGYLPGHGILPAESVRNLAAKAKIKPLVVPAAPTDAKTVADIGEEPGPPEFSDSPNTPAPEGAEPGYRPSVALSEFIRFRDLTCRFPGCDAP